METLDIWGGMGAQPIDTEASLTWWENLRRYYNLDNWDTPAFHRMAGLGWFVRIGLSIIPWSFFGLGIISCVYFELQNGELRNPLTACTETARKTLPFKTVILLTILICLIWQVWSGGKTDLIGSRMYFAAFFFLCIAGLIGTFSFFSIYQLFRWLRKLYNQIDKEKATLQPFPVWLVKQMFYLILTLIYSVGCTAGAGFLLFQIILYCVVGNSSPPLERQQIAMLTALSFLPTVALNGLFWAILPWSLFRFFRTDNRIADAPKTKDNKIQSGSFSPPLQ